MLQSGPKYIEVRHLFRPLDKKLIQLLEALENEQWDHQTIAGQWTVKDVVSHLLDGNIRTLSIQRDGYFGQKPPQDYGYQQLVDWLNQLNADWIKATKRISPDVLILLHKTTGEWVSDYFESLNPLDESIFPVDWAGESTSYNWMHLAREYTEKWHHQQQIREATGLEGIMTREFYYPCMDTFFRAMPHTFKEVAAETGTRIKTTVFSEIGGSWWLTRGPERWELTNDGGGTAEAEVEIPPQLAWKLFSKSLSPDEVYSQVKIKGDEKLGRRVLDMVSVMAYRGNSKT